jgi:hypothetical protein
MPVRNLSILHFSCGKTPGGLATEVANTPGVFPSNCAECVVIQAYLGERLRRVDWLQKLPIHQESFLPICGLPAIWLFTSSVKEYVMCPSLPTRYTSGSSLIWGKDSAGWIGYRSCQYTRSLSFQLA